MNREEALATIARIQDATDEQLAEALAVLAADAEALGADPTPENLDQLQAIVEAAESIADAQNARAEARAANEARAAELLGRIPGLAPAAGDDDDELGDEIAAEVDEIAEIAAEVTVPDDASSIPEAAPQPVPAANAGTVTAAARRPATTRPRAAAGLAQAQRSAARPATRTTTESDALPLVASAGLAGFTEGQHIGPDQWTRFADGVIAATQAHALPPGRVWSDDKIEAAEFARYGGGSKISLAKVPVRFGGAPTLEADALRNESVLDRVRTDTLAQFRQALSPAMVAAGGCPCAPYPVDYSIFNLVESYNPMDADIPGVQMPRGGIRYMECLDWAGYAAGTEVRDCADENVAIGSYVAKPCVRITCPTEQSTAPIIIPACLTVGNFISNTYPELVRQALEWLGVHYEDLKQVAYEDAIRANAIAGTNYTSATVYGAARDYLAAVTRATASYRARRHMRPDSPLQVMVPYWLPWVLVNDVRNQGFGGLAQAGEITNPEAWFREQLRTINVVPSFWFLKPTGVNAAQWIDRAQTDAAALNAWPTSVETIITAPGVWNRGQIADIDFGLVVDSPLIRTNDAMYFMETMVSIFNRCSTATELLTSTLCPSGAAANLVTPFTCS